MTKNKCVLILANLRSIFIFRGAISCFLGAANHFRAVRFFILVPRSVAFWTCSWIPARRRAKCFCVFAAEK
jgi:hypothetical protein